MIIAIPVEEKKQEGMVCPSFGRTPFYMIYDSENAEVQFMKNTASDASGGAGIKAAQLLVDEKVDAVITPRCGKNAAEVLVGGQIKIFESAGLDIMQNIDGFSQGNLSILDAFHAGFHGHGGTK